MNVERAIDKQLKATAELVREGMKIVVHLAKSHRELAKSHQELTQTVNRLARMWNSQRR